MNKLELLENLLKAFNESPYPSLKVSNYFPIYTDLFGHLVDTNCTFIETGVLNGGSLFMWRTWLGKDARIIGIDLNPNAKKWEEHGFEIYIGDQGDPEFWDSVFPSIGKFDAFLDDGGHQSFQQIVTLVNAMAYMKPESVIAIEDTVTSHMNDFNQHGNRSFLEYAKDSTDVLAARSSSLWPDSYLKLRNPNIIDFFAKIYSIEFFSGIVAFKANAAFATKPHHVINMDMGELARDYRHDGLTKSALVEWPDPFTTTIVQVSGKD